MGYILCHWSVSLLCVATQILGLKKRIPEKYFFCTYDIIEILNHVSSNIIHLIHRTQLSPDNNFDILGGNINLLVRVIPIIIPRSFKYTRMHWQDTKPSPVDCSRPHLGLITSSHSPVPIKHQRWKLYGKVKMLVECEVARCEWDTTRKLHQEIADVFHASFKRSGRIEKLKKECLTFFIRRQGKVATCAYGTPIAEGELLIHFITTAHHMRKKGYACALLKAIYQSEPLNIDRITLNIDINHKEARDFYLHRNFKRMSSQERKERDLLLEGEDTYSFKGGDMNLGKISVNGICSGQISNVKAEWYNPLKVDQIRTILSKVKKEKVLRFHSVHFGWKTESEKWSLMDLTRYDREKSMRNPLKTYNVEKVFALVNDDKKEQAIDKESNDNDRKRKYSEQTDSDDNGSPMGKKKHIPANNIVLGTTSSIGRANRAEEVKQCYTFDATDNGGGVPKAASLETEESSDSDYSGEELSLAHREWKLMEDLEELRSSLDRFSEKIDYYLKR